MNKIGIIAAMEQEMQEIKKIIIDIKVSKIYDLVFYEGSINLKSVVLVESGIGKVNAARVTQILIDKYKVTSIINIGSAGAANSKLNIGDIVIGDNLVQHDFDITAFGHPKGYISNIGVNIQSDKQMVNKMRNIIENIDISGEKVIIGTIVSGDIFCTDVSMKDKIRKKFNAEAIEMEGAAVAQVCKLCNVPFVVVRGISDSPNGNNNITFEKYLEKASKKCAIMLKKYFEA